MSRDINPFGLRMPPELRSELEAACAETGRSLNAEIVHRLEASTDPSRAPVSTEHRDLIDVVAEGLNLISRKIGDLRLRLRNQHRFTPLENRDHHEMLEDAVRHRDELMSLLNGVSDGLDQRHLEMMYVEIVSKLRHSLLGFAERTKRNIALSIQRYEASGKDASAAEAGMSRVNNLIHAAQSEFDWGAEGVISSQAEISDEEAKPRRTKRK